MFLFIHFIYQSLVLFCLLKLILFSQFNSFLPNLLSREHHIFHTVEIARFFRKKKTGNKIGVLSFLATKRLCSFKRHLKPQFTNNYSKLWELIYFANTTNQKMHFQLNLEVLYSSSTDV